MVVERPLVQIRTASTGFGCKGYCATHIHVEWSDVPERIRNSHIYVCKACKGNGLAVPSESGQALHTRNRNPAHPVEVAKGPSYPSC